MKKMAERKGLEETAEKKHREREQRQFRKRTANNDHDTD